MSRHWPPRTGERLFDAERDKDGVYPEGTIIAVLRDYESEDDSEVYVKFLKPKTIQSSGTWVLVYNDDLHWDARSPGFKIERAYYIWIGSEYERSGEVEYKTYPFSELEGNWSSSDGGLDRWELL